MKKSGRQSGNEVEVGNLVSLPHGLMLPLSRAAKHEVILAAVSARIGVDKPDTVYAPMLSTWLNQRRWENEGAEPAMSAADLDAANRRLEERQKKHREQMSQLAEQRSNQLLGRVS